MFKNFLIFLLLFFPLSALAHSPLASLSPPDGASVDQNAVTDRDGVQVAGKTY
ncbi:MAG: hypothetical protein ACJZ89_07440 [Paracoccaceae bacterium]